jgi:hypothetical protein
MEFLRHLYDADNLLLFDGVIKEAFIADRR